MSITEAQALCVVELPPGDIGDEKTGIDFSGSPPQISSIQPFSPLVGRVSVGQYCHGIALEGVEIMHLNDANHLKELLKQNSYSPKRELLLSDNPYYIDPFIAADDCAMGENSAVMTRCVLYKHTLPACKHLGILFQGFPPYITQVELDCEFAGKLHPHQTVHALAVPGQPLFHLPSGGFSSKNLLQRLLQTSHISGRQLIVKDGVIGERDKGSGAAIDADSLSGPTSWWNVKRCLGFKK